MRVPCEETNIYKLYLSCVIYGIEVHHLSKLKITNIEVDILNKEKIPDKKFLEQYRCLCYKDPYDILVYFYYNLEDYYKLYPQNKNCVEEINLECPYEIKIELKDERGIKRKLIVKITGLFSCGLNTSIIEDGGLAFFRYGTPIVYIMTLEEKELLTNLKELEYI